MFPSLKDRASLLQEDVAILGGIGLPEFKLDSWTGKNANLMVNNAG